MKNTMSSNETFIGGLSAIGAYVLWGILPIYWKWVGGVPADQVLAHRIVWSFAFMIVVLLATRKVKQLTEDIRALFASRRRLLTIVGASLVITMNWFGFIWAIDSGHVIQASLGYYINPLVSVLLGVAFLKERLNRWQTVSFLLALAGVVLMTVEAGMFPWLSILLALTFGVYGLLKKTVQLRALTGLTIETMVMTPAALLYLPLSGPQAQLFPTADPRTVALLVGAGAITAVPLLLFAAGANRISLTMIGFFQYIGPTIMLILGTLLYREPFDSGNLLAFILIWVSLVLFSLSRTKRWSGAGRQAAPAAGKMEIAGK